MSVRVPEDTLEPVARKDRRLVPASAGRPTWQPTESLARSVLGGVAVAVVAVGWGRPDLWVLAAPLLVTAVAAVVRRPPPAGDRSPSVTPASRSLPEGWSTLVRTRVEDVLGAEQLTRAFDDLPFVDLDPELPARAEAVDPTLASHDLEHEVAVRRWGVRDVGAGAVAATSGWSGWRWGPVRVPGSPVTALPTTEAFASRGQAPNPVGLVGAHRAARVGDGTEFTGIRPFVVGDRLRRINWRVSLATGELHVVQTRADQDTAVLLLVDVSTDAGRSGGLGSTSSSLDLTVRAAAALAEHHLGLGDRVGLRLLGGTAPPVGFGSGATQRMRILHTLAAPGRARPAEQTASRLRLRAPEGTVVLMLTSMLTPQSTATAAAVARSNLPLVVVDTLPDHVEQPGTAATAWRWRLLERRQVLEEVSRAGIAVVPWRGPGTLDDVLRRLARRSRLPRLVRR